jgi:hypothetical protein
MKYAIIDMGRNMASYCKLLENELIKDGIHHIIYLTDVDGLLCMEFVSEDEFLDHFKNTNNGKA